MVQENPEVNHPVIIMPRDSIGNIVSTSTLPGEVASHCDTLGAELVNCLS